MSHRADLPEIPVEFYSKEKILKKFLNDLDVPEMKKLELIYVFMQDYSEFVKSFAVCSEGCSFCCRIDVQLTDYEAAYISKNTGKPMAAVSSVTTGHTSPCPFLSEKGSCTIYAFRPFVCRSYHTLDDPKFCEEGDVDHDVYGSAAMAVEEGEKYNFGVSYYHRLHERLLLINGERGMGDMRDYFGSGCENS